MTNFEKILKAVEQIRALSIEPEDFYHKIVDMINVARLRFIREKGYEPDTIIFNHNVFPNGVEQFSRICGMNIKTNSAVPEDSFVLCKRIGTPFEKPD